MGISLRLLALILCSNCSNTFNKVLITIGGHMLNYFLKLEVSLELAQYSSCMVEAFHSRHDLCTPSPNTPPHTSNIPNLPINISTCHIPLEIGTVSRCTTRPMEDKLLQNHLPMVFSLIKNESMGIEVYEILLMFSLIKNESMGGDCRLSGTVGVFIHQEQKYWD